MVVAPMRRMMPLVEPAMRLINVADPRLLGSMLSLVKAMIPILAPMEKILWIFPRPT